MRPAPKHPQPWQSSTPDSSESRYDGGNITQIGDVIALQIYGDILVTLWLPLLARNGDASCRQAGPCCWPQRCSCLPPASGRGRLLPASFVKSFNEATAVSITRLPAPRPTAPIIAPAGTSAAQCLLVNQSIVVGIAGWTSIGVSNMGAVTIYSAAAAVSPTKLVPALW